MPVKQPTCLYDRDLRKHEDDLPFSLFISMQRRRKLIDALLHIGDRDSKKYKEGENIMNNYRKQLVNKMARDRVDEAER